MEPPVSDAIATVHLRPGHVQPIWAGHPWVYAQAIARVEGPTPTPGDEVRVVDPQGHGMGRGFWSPRKAIPVRIVLREDTTSFDDPAWLVERLKAATARRRAIGLPSTQPGRESDGFRLLHAEGDGVPGLVVDRFGTEADGTGGVAVVQVGTAGLRRRAQLILDAIEQTLRPKAIVDRTTVSVAQSEGFTLDDALSAHTPDAPLRFRERGLQFEIPGDVGQKTGFYFDQRPLRERVEQLSAGRRVLDAYCYVGGIALSAARGGATSVLGLDDSLRAIDVAGSCARANGLDGIASFLRGDVRKELPRLTAEGASFDLVVLDPPKLAPTRGDRDAAIKYQTKLIEAAAAVVAPGGLLVVSSCSAALGAGELARCLAIGARRVGRGATVLDRLGQGGDHPVPAAFPEGVYLSTLIAELG
jgi:23S rRNA (cytosine1962-C5)-methyltransferase